MSRSCPNISVDWRENPGQWIGFSGKILTRNHGDFSHAFLFLLSLKPWFSQLFPMKSHTWDRATVQGVDGLLGFRGRAVGHNGWTFTTPLHLYLGSGELVKREKHKQQNYENTYVYIYIYMCVYVYIYYWNMCIWYMCTCIFIYIYR